jgi:Na+/H+-dicarboxylate symporter
MANKEIESNANSTTLKIALGLILGLLFGWLWPQATAPIAWVGSLFMSALKMIIAPLIFTSVLCGMLGAGLNHRLKKIATRTFIYFFINSLIAITTGLFFVHWLKPGIGKNLLSGGSASVANYHEITLGGFMQSQVQNIFQNPFQALASMNVLSVIVFSIFLGWAINSVPQNRVIKEVIFSLNHAIMKMVEVIMRFAPFGIFSLVAVMMAKMGPELLLSVGKFIATVLGGTAFHFFITFPLILFFVARTSPWNFFKKTYPAMLVAFSTSSSAATLPVSLNVVKNRLKIPAPVANFILPLGTSVNMDGTALYEAVAALFVAQLYGIELSLFQQIIVVVTAMLSSMGAAGIPSAGMVTLIVVLQAVNLPLEPVALLLSFDRFLDTFRTAMNVTGDMVGCVVVGKSLKGRG